MSAYQDAIDSGLSHSKIVLICAVASATIAAEQGLVRLNIGLDEKGVELANALARENFRASQEEFDACYNLLVEEGHMEVLSGAQQVASARLH